MKTKLLSGSLQEDLDALGIPGLSESAMASIALKPALSEQGVAKPDPDEEEEEETGDEDEYDESVHDPIEGPFVTPALFDRIMALPLDTLDEDQIGQIIAGLKGKRVPSNIEGIQEQAAKVAKALVEAKQKTIIWKGRRKRIKIDTSGEAMKKRRERRRTARRKRSKIALTTAKWSKKAGAKRAASKTAAMHQRMGEGDFAVELEHLLSESQDRADNVREDIMRHLDDIIDLVTDEFDDDGVDSVFEEAVKPLASSYRAGRMDEDTMSVEAFLAEIRPLMTLISKSVDRIERSDLGN